MIEPVVIGDATLYLGDCREILPGLQFDVLLTDPVWPRCPKQTIIGSDRPYELWAETCAALPEHKRTIVVMRCDCDPRFLMPTPGPFFRSINLPYVIPGYLGRALGGDETAYWFGSCIKRGPGRMVVPGRARRTAKPFNPALVEAITGKERGSCSWPIGDPSDADFRFCGRPVLGPGRSYCASHDEVASFRAKQKRRPQIDTRQ